MLKREAKTEPEYSCMISGYHQPMAPGGQSAGLVCFSYVGESTLFSGVMARLGHSRMPAKAARTFCIGPQSFVTCLVAGTPMQTSQLNFRMPALRERHAG